MLNGCDMKNWQRADVQKVDRKGGEVEQDRDGRTALRETWKQREKKKQVQEKEES